MQSNGSYPSFPDGDVLIIAPTGRLWKLHAFYLQNSCMWFRDAFEATPGAHLTKRQKSEGKTIQWKFRMVVLERHNENFVTFRSLDLRAKQPLIIPPNINGIGGEPPYLQIYDNLFRAIYSMDAILDTEDPSLMATQCISLLQAAELLGGGNCVQRVIETHLLRAGQSFWPLVKKHPAWWMDVAIRIQSPVIYREAILHVIGSWNLPGTSRKEQVRKCQNRKIMERIIQEKIGEEKQIKRDVERHLLEDFPPEMMHLSPPVPVRATYASDIYQWQALTIVRQWICSQYMEGHHHTAPDGGAIFYRQISRGNTAYMKREDLDLFYQNFNMSAKGRDCLDRALWFVKDFLAPIVEPLLVDNSRMFNEANGSRPEHKYLTFTTVKDTELPWYKPLPNPEDALYAPRGQEKGAVVVKSEVEDDEDYYEEDARDVA